MPGNKKSLYHSSFLSDSAAGRVAAFFRFLALVPNKASSDAGPELAGRESHEAMESPEALMCPLEKGVRGIEISKSPRWQPCC